jgi:hypothetical protein
MIIKLIQLCSVIEPKDFTYLMTQYSNEFTDNSLEKKNEESTIESIENLRISLLRSGPIYDIISLLIEKKINKNLYTELIPQLCDLIKTSSGLPTRVSISNFFEDASRKENFINFLNNNSNYYKTIVKSFLQYSILKTSRSLSFLKLLFVIKYLLKKKKFSKNDY